MGNVDNCAAIETDVNDQTLSANQFFNSKIEYILL